jgi:hypothetical protein
MTTAPETATVAVTAIILAVVVVRIIGRIALYALLLVGLIAAGAYWSGNL